jgi:hypothetical protein
MLFLQGAEKIQDPNESFVSVVGELGDAGPGQDQRFRLQRGFQ